MLKVTVAQPFVWSAGHKAVLVEKGPQQLTKEQRAHAEKHGFLQAAAKPVVTKDNPKEQDND